jgi:hypothetical protein
MNSSNLGFKNLPPFWQACSQDVALYGAQKSINLGSTETAAKGRFQQAVISGTSGVADIWHNVFKSRINAITGNEGFPPVIFPGRSPLLSDQIARENYAYERFQIFVHKKLMRKTEVSFASAQSEDDTRSWGWETLLPSAMHQATQISAREIQAPFTFEPPHQITLEAVTEKFISIHSAWSSLSIENYPKEALSQAITSLKENEGTTNLWFELEEFASYCSLRESLNIVASGFYNEKWIDIGSESIHNLRGTERCSPTRLMQEIENLAHGRIAPLIVNEFRCVSDGNHRLVAAWIWNMLHASIHCSWQTGDRQFEVLLRHYLEPYIDATTRFTVWSALKCLSSLLNNEESKHDLDTLRPLIAKHRIPTLPVVPMLAYNNFALDGTAYDNEGVLVRFAPNLYSELHKNAAMFFPARACYHLADRVPLPWFSILEPSPASSFASFYSPKGLDQTANREQLSLFTRQPQRV